MRDDRSDTGEPKAMPTPAKRREMTLAPCSMSRQFGWVLRYVLGCYATSLLDSTSQKEACLGGERERGAKAVEIMQRFKQSFSNIVTVVQQNVCRQSFVLMIGDRYIEGL